MMQAEMEISAELCLRKGLTRSEIYGMTACIFNRSGISGGG